MSVPDDAATVLERDLKQQLDAKNKLVRALTDRLEEAAEQLDRVQRTGGDKSARSTGPVSDSGGGSHPLLSKLSKSLQVWEDVDPGESFARIEQRLDELRDMLDGAMLAPGGQAETPQGNGAPRNWEQMKAQVIQECEQDDDSPNKPKSSPEVPIPEAAGSDSDEEQGASAADQSPAPPPVPEQPHRPISELKLPEPVDPALASRTQLEEALEVRNQYIAELTRRLRTAESRTYQPVDWAALNNAPVDLRARLQHLESELTDRLRIAEVDLSLERARLSRVETRIRETQQQIEKRVQQSVGFEQPEGQSESKQSEGKSRGWFRSRK